MSALWTLPSRRLRLAFFGTPDIAAACLKALIDADEDDLVWVLSQPDRPKGRSKKLEPTPVKAVAESAGLPVLQPSRLKDGGIAAKLLASKLDLAIVVAYGRIMPKALFTAPQQGSLNLHASLLPRHRGAAPIQEAILAGDAETGVTLMQISEGLDEGDWLLKRSLPIHPDDTGSTLTERLTELGAQTLVEGLRLAKAGGLPVTPQDPALATYAPMRKKADGELDFHRDASALKRQIQAFEPWPGSFVSTPNGPLRVLAAEVVPGDPSLASGCLLQLGPDLVVNCSRDALRLLKLQPAGKRAMDAKAFLNGAGRALQLGETLG